MKRIPPDRCAVVLATLFLAACANRPAPQTAPAPDDIPPLPAVRIDSAGMARARADSLRHPYTDADVRFIAGMIPHHAQAITMSRLARTRGAGPAVQRLADRIINAQVDEIVTMQQWLADRGKPVPEAMFGLEHAHHMAMMPGMLTPEQMQALAAGKGAEFDRLFLTYMIQHHKGAVDMVKELFASYGAAQDELVFKFSSDVNVDQTTEIARMELMLTAMSPQPRNHQ